MWSVGAQEGLNCSPRRVPCPGVLGAQIGDESLWEEETQDGVLELRKAEASPGEGVELGEQELKP